METWYDILLELAIFSAVTFLSYATLRELRRQTVLRQRLGAADAPRAATSLLRHSGVSGSFLRWVQSATSINKPEERERLAAELSKAGFDHPSAPVWYVVARYGLALGLPLLLILTRQLIGRPASGLPAFTLPLALCMIGLLLPRTFVRQRISSRRSTLEQQFPDALDLMVICMDAGLSLEAAILRINREMRRSHPEIAREFARVSEELAAGRSRADTLRAMSERLDIPAIRGFVSLLVQSQTLGASVAQGLKTYANEMRGARAMRAEEKAMRVPVLISIPLVICFLPVIVEALLLPSAIDMIRRVAPALKGIHP